MSLALRAVRCRFYLAGACEKLGMFEKAAEKYREFMTTWKHGDTGLVIEEVQTYGSGWTERNRGSRYLTTDRYL